MGSLSAIPISSTEMEVSWSYGTPSDINGIIQSLTITQTAPDGTQTSQNLPPDSSGPTYFKLLQPSTLYSYELDAPWEDEYGDLNTETLYGSGTTKAAGTPTHMPPPPPPTKPIPGPITGLSANWDTPAYTSITVHWTDGANTTNYKVVAVGPTTINSPVLTPGYGEPQGYRFGAPPASYSIEVTTSNEYGSAPPKSVSLAAPPGPGAISKLVASWNSGYTAVNLSWSQGSGTPTTGMELKRYAGNYSASGTAQESVPIAPTSPCTDIPTVISSSSQYQYELIASNTFGSSPAVSNVLSPPQAPAAPTNVVAKWTVNYTQAEVMWDAVDHATSYEVVVWKWTLVDGPTQIEDHANITSTTFTEALTGQQSVWYQFQVIAHNRIGSGSTPIYPNNSTTDTLTVGASGGGGTPPPPPGSPPAHHPVISNKP